MHGPQMLRRMCGSSVNKAVHVLATILLVHLVGQPSKIRFDHTGVLPFYTQKICVMFPCFTAFF